MQRCIVLLGSPACCKCTAVQLARTGGMCAPTQRLSTRAALSSLSDASRSSSTMPGQDGAGVNRPAALCPRHWPQAPELPSRVQRLGPGGSILLPAHYWGG